MLIDHWFVFYMNMSFIFGASRLILKRLCAHTAYCTLNVSLWIHCRDKVIYFRLFLYRKNKPNWMEYYTSKESLLFSHFVEQTFPCSRLQYNFFSEWINKTIFLFLNSFKKCANPPHDWILRWIFFLETTIWKKKKPNWVCRFFGVEMVKFTH